VQRKTHSLRLEALDQDSVKERNDSFDALERRLGSLSSDRPTDRQPGAALHGLALLTMFLKRARETRRGENT